MKKEIDGLSEGVIIALAQSFVYEPCISMVKKQRDYSYVNGTIPCVLPKYLKDFAKGKKTKVIQGPKIIQCH